MNILVHLSCILEAIGAGSVTVALGKLQDLWLQMIGGTTQDCWGVSIRILRMIFK